MSPANTNHTTVVGNIYRILSTHFHGKPCRAFVDGLMVHFSENDKVVPDAMIVCNRGIVTRQGIQGTPDLIVEVLSSSTALNDRGYKKDMYERYGVKEYWIVDPYKRSVEVYDLQNDRLKLNNIYILSSDELNDLPPEERAAVETTLYCPLFPELTIRLDDMFYDIL